MDILRKWKTTDGTFVFIESGRRSRVWVDTLCPLEIDSFAIELCVN